MADTKKHKKRTAKKREASLARLEGRESLWARFKRSHRSKTGIFGEHVFDWSLHEYLKRWVDFQRTAAKEFEEAKAREGRK
ncbi:hypothetical protein NX059_007596 [Plenodomus lindquistii]|nr:hypothetical protein NX059_007596 [Plenodomus lindquistii]